MWSLMLDYGFLQPLLNALLLYRFLYQVCAESVSYFWLFGITWTVAPGSSVYAIFQARILEWVAISYSRWSFQSSGRTPASSVSWAGRQILHHCTTEEAPYSKVGALGRPRGIGWRGRWEGRSEWGTHVNPWLIHVNVWQKPLQYCKVISLQLIKINGKKKSSTPKKKKPTKVELKKTHTVNNNVISFYGDRC